MQAVCKPEGQAENVPLLPQSRSRRTYFFTVYLLERTLRLWTDNKPPSGERPD